MNRNSTRAKKKLRFRNFGERNNRELIKARHALPFSSWLANVRHNVDMSKTKLSQRSEEEKAKPDIMKSEEEFDAIDL